MMSAPEGELDNVYDRPQWHPYWPKPLSIFWLLMAIVFGSLVGAVLLIIVGAIAQQQWTTLITLVPSVVFMSVMFVQALDRTGLSRSGVPNSVQSIDSAEYGPGLWIRRRSRAPLMVALLVMAVGFGSSGSGVGLGVCAFLVAAVLVIVVQTRIDVVLHADGIRRRSTAVHWYRLVRFEDFVRWDDVMALEPDTFDVYSGHFVLSDPIIRVRSHSLKPTRRQQRLDGDGSLVLRAFELAVDPNALMALVLWCTRFPWARQRLGALDARLLLECPPLRDRLRLSREESRLR